MNRQSFPRGTGVRARACLAAVAAAALLAAVAVPPAFALDISADCLPVAKAMQAEMKAPAWHKTSNMKLRAGSMSFELIKADGQLYQRRNGPWMKMAVDAAQVNRTNGELLQSGKLHLGGCRKAGLEVIGGVPTVIYAYTSTIDGAAKPIEAKVWIGVADDLPYRIDTGVMSQLIEYKGVTAPR